MCQRPCSWSRSVPIVSLLNARMPQWDLFFSLHLRICPESTAPSRVPRGCSGWCGVSAPPISLAARLCVAGGGRLPRIPSTPPPLSYPPSRVRTQHAESGSRGQPHPHPLLQTVHTLRPLGRSRAGGVSRCWVCAPPRPHPAEGLAPHRQPTWLELNGRTRHPPGNATAEPPSAPSPPPCFRHLWQTARARGVFGSHCWRQPAWQSRSVRGGRSCRRRCATHWRPFPFFTLFFSSPCNQWLAWCCH